MNLSFLMGYNWINQICNHDYARDATFKDKFHLIRHNKPDSKKQGLYPTCENVASPGRQTLGQVCSVAVESQPLKL